MSTGNLEEMFDSEMWRLYEKQRQVMRDPIRFRGMLVNRAGLATAIQMLDSPTPGDGFMVLFEKGESNLSVEALVLKEPWHTLFTEGQLAVARSRLEGWGSSSI